MVSNFFLLIAVVTFYASTSRMEGKPVVVSPGSVVWDSNSTSNVEWYALDDGVMGGKSKTNLPPGIKFDGNWTGVVSTANNGGFAGIRTRLFSPLKDASACSGYLLTLTGDGQRYKFVTRDTAAWDGIAWSAPFNTTIGEQVIIKIPFNELIPTMRASTVRISHPFNTKHISDVQLTLSKFEYDGVLNPSFQAGPFHLFLDQISFF